MFGVTCTSVGTEVFMNDLGGSCEGAGENTLSCAEGFDCVRTPFCPGLEGIVIGELVNTCCGLAVELEEVSGFLGIEVMLISFNDPGCALLLSCDGLVGFCVVNAGDCDNEGVARLC